MRDTTEPDPAAREVIAPTTIVLNRAFEEAVGPDGIRAYVDALVATGRSAGGLTADEVAPLLRQRLESAGLTESDVSLLRRAEQLVQAGTLTVLSADGEVLHNALADVADNAPGLRSRPAESAAEAGHDHVNGTKEPEDPDRPAYS